jgi:TatD DNase family protein
MLLETDAPFLAPQPHRGERNEPAYIRWVAEEIATLTNTPLSSVARVTTNNAARLFAWRETV